MMRHIPWIGASTLLAIALTAVPARADDSDKPKSTEDRLTAIEAQLKKVTDSLNALLAIQKLQGDVNEMKDTVARLQRDLETMRGKMDSQTRTAFSPPIGGTGRIRLLNQYSSPMTMVVNGISYRLDPGRERVLDAQPAGPFTYEVLGVQPAITRVLAANETFTIFVYPR